MEVSLGYAAARTLTDVPEAARLAQPARREARRHLPDAPGETGLAAPVPCRIQSLPDDLLGGVDYCLGCGPIFQSKAALFRNGKAGRL